MHLLKGSEALFFSSFSHFTHWGSKKSFYEYLDFVPVWYLRKMQFCYFACSASFGGPSCWCPFDVWETNLVCKMNFETTNHSPLSPVPSLNYDMHFALDLLQPIPSLWLLTKCITSQVQPTARYTAVALRTVFQKSCCKRLSPILVPYRRSASSRTRDTHLSGKSILSMSIIEQANFTPMQWCHHCQMLWNGRV